MKTKSLPRALLDEIVRVETQVIPAYKDIGEAGKPGLALIRIQLEMAKATFDSEESAAEMIAYFVTLREVKS